MRLIIGYDGTSKDDREIDNCSNVWRFMECVELGGTEEQRKKYIPGVGVSGNFTADKLAQALGSGMGHHLHFSLPPDLGLVQVFRRRSSRDTNGYVKITKIRTIASASRASPGVRVQLADSFALSTIWASYDRSVLQVMDSGISRTCGYAYAGIRRRTESLSTLGCGMRRILNKALLSYLPGTRILREAAPGLNFAFCGTR